MMLSDDSQMTTAGDVEASRRMREKVPSFDVKRRHRPLEHFPKKLIDFFDQNMLHLLESEPSILHLIGSALVVGQRHRYRPTFLTGHGGARDAYSIC